MLGEFFSGQWTALLGWTCSLGSGIISLHRKSMIHTVIAPKFNGHLVTNYF